MWRLINIWLGKGLEKLVLGAGAAAAFFAMLWRAKNKGKLEERERQERQRQAELAEAQGDRIDKMRVAQEVRNEAAGLSGDELDRRLRERWGREDRGD